jgi:hypothetical protein
LECATINDALRAVLSIAGQSAQQQTSDRSEPNLRAVDNDGF